MSVLDTKWLKKQATLCDQNRLRMAEDLPQAPSKLSNGGRSHSAYMNWSDLRAFSDALAWLVPELVYLPAIYMGGGYNREEPPGEVIPIHRSFIDCMLDGAHGVIVVVNIRWPWPDEQASNNPDVIAGRIDGPQSPWFDPPWRLPTKWSRLRRAGRRVSIAVHFRGYELLQNIKQCQGEVFWGTKKNNKGVKPVDTIPESWIFRDASACVLNASYIQEDQDDVFFCKLISDLWRKCSTDLFGSYDAKTGSVITPERKSYEVRYGWNTLKHGITGSRHFLHIAPGKEDGRFHAIGPAERQIEKVERSPDLEAFDAYDFIYPRERRALATS